MLPVDETIWSSSTSTAPTSSATNRRTTQLQPKSNSNHAQVLYDVENFSADWTLDHDAATRTNCNRRNAALRTAPNRRRMNEPRGQAVTTTSEAGTKADAMDAIVPATWCSKTGIRIPVQLYQSRLLRSFTHLTLETCDTDT